MNVKTVLQITFNDGKTINLELPELCEKLGVQDSIQNISLQISNNDLGLKASISPNEPGYPEIYLDYLRRGSLILRKTSTLHRGKKHEHKNNLTNCTQRR